MNPLIRRAHVGLIHQLRPRRTNNTWCFVSTTAHINLLRKNQVVRTQLTSSQQYGRRMSNSTKQEATSTFFDSIRKQLQIELQGLAHWHQLLRNITLQDITVRFTRLSALIGTIHVTTEYGLRTFMCEGPSMEPTIIDGSFTLVLVERWSHRLFGLDTDFDNTDECENNTNSQDVELIEEKDALQRLKQKWIALLNGIWKQHFTSGLQRGDVIILSHPLREGTLCKRIIGMPGDILIRTDGGSKETNHRVYVPPGHFWIEGDNTTNSVDSRSYGAIPASLTIGKVICRLWPLRDYAWCGMDGNGRHQWKSMDARIGRGERPMPSDGSEFWGSHVLGRRRWNVDG